MYGRGRPGIPRHVADDRRELGQAEGVRLDGVVGVADLQAHGQARHAHLDVTLERHEPGHPPAHLPEPVLHGHVADLEPDRLQDRRDLVDIVLLVGLDRREVPLQVELPGRSEHGLDDGVAVELDPEGARHHPDVPLPGRHPELDQPDPTAVREPDLRRVARGIAIERLAALHQGVPREAGARRGHEQPIVSRLRHEVPGPRGDVIGDPDSLDGNGHHLPGAFHHDPAGSVPPPVDHRRGLPSVDQPVAPERPDPHGYALAGGRAVPEHRGVDDSPLPPCEPDELPGGRVRVRGGQGRRVRPQPQRVPGRIGVRADCHALEYGHE